MEADLAGMQNRGQRYWYEDGIAELVLGALFTVFSAYHLVSFLIPGGSVARPLVGVGFVVVVPAGMWWAGRMVRRLKARITVPRTGYVSFSRSSRRYLRTLVIAAACSALAVAATLLLRGVFVPPILAGAGLGLGMTWVAGRLKLPRFAAIGTGSLAVGIAVGLLFDDSAVAFTLYFAAVGLMFAGSGTFTLIGYLHRRPQPEGSAGDGDGEDA
jgi:hypothetical protein